MKVRGDRVSEGTTGGERRKLGRQKAQAGKTRNEKEKPE